MKTYPPSLLVVVSQCVVWKFAVVAVVVDDVIDVFVVVVVWSFCVVAFDFPSETTGEKWDDEPKGNLLLLRPHLGYRHPWLLLLVCLSRV